MGESVRNVPRAERMATPLRAVIDPRVLQGAIWGGRSSTLIIDAWIEDRVHFCVTEKVMRDYFRTLGRLQTTALLELVLRRLRAGDGIRAFIVESGLVPPEDELVQCALAAEAVAVVTHDRNLLDLGQVGPVALQTPGGFAQRHLQEQLAGKEPSGDQGR